ncbi:FmdB family zinc ribbon protein [Novispirillum sp. DQ9]|uniref:FmdB family zinc ribbon protein n=1 Tax=Novispirillum sp. DQ9 TaxID=3398612 RepID=UPI003C7A2992
MPFYSYRCQACGTEFETLVGAGEAPACPSCGAGALDRLISSGTGIGGKSAGVLRNARAAAAREGHLSNYRKSEIPRK